MVGQIPKSSGLGRASLHAGWNYFHSYFFILFYSPVYTMKAESTFFDHPPRSLGERPGFPAASVQWRIGTVVFFPYLVLVIKIPGIIRTGHYAIPATDASPEILHHDPIFPKIGGLGRANGHAGRIFTVHAGHGQEFNPYVWVLAPTYGQYLVPIHFPPPGLFFRRPMRDVILLPAGYGTGLTGDAFIQIDDHTPFGHVNPQAL
jgi:hypothetical protein